MQGEKAVAGDTLLNGGTGKFPLIFIFNINCQYLAAFLGIN